MGDELYQKDDIKIAGSYKREPVENGWHEITISKEAYSREEYKWTNREGVSWKFQRTTSDNSDDSNTYSVGEDCPYFEDGVRNITVEIVNGNIIGLRFGDDLYKQEQKYNDEIDADDDEPEIEIPAGIF